MCLRHGAAGGGTMVKSFGDHAANERAFRA